MTERTWRLWQLLDLLRQVRRQRVWWAAQDPATYGGYVEGIR